MKNKILTTLLILLVLGAYGTYRLGNRSITIKVDGQPATTSKIRMLKSGEILDLDESGSLDLAWGIKKVEDPAFFFQSSPTNVWILRLPDKGSVTFNLSGTTVETDVEMSVGLFKVKRKISQTHEPHKPGQVDPPQNDVPAEE